MGIFDIFNRNKKSNELNNVNNLNAKGYIERKEVYLYSSIVEMLKKKYIAFDIETTGLNPVEDRIVELGAVLFENGIPVKKFSSLVNPNKFISFEATRVNNISNEMIQNAPRENIIYPKLVEFLEDSLSGETVICAHNARFDIGFLSNTLERLGYSGNIKYIDTLSLSRNLIYVLENYKQSTVADYFDIINEEAHRAVTDAETCGKILYHFLDYEIKEKQTEKKRNISALDDYEKIVFAYIEKLINDNGLNIDFLGARKNASGYINICYLYSFIKYKFSKKGKYIIVSNDFSKNLELPVEQCNISEGGNEFIRVYFSSIDDIKQLDEYILNEYKKSYNATMDYIDGSSRREKNVIEEVENLYKISVQEVEKIINNEISNKTLNNYLSEINIKKQVSRDEININPVNNRIPLNKIKNLNDWNKGYDEGFDFWLKGDELRKNGEYNEAIKLLDLSRYNGYNTYVLYESYAMVYHQLKDYDNEIAILEEGIERLSKDNTNVSNLVTRRDKAVQIIYKKIEQEKQAQQRLIEKEEKRKLREEKKLKEKQEKAELRKNTLKEPVTGRSIIQMNDDGVIIKKYISIADAVRQTGINSKSIRDAAKGVQKHAGGYCWKYEDDA